MILTELPDLPPRPLTARSAAFRRDFYRRWGRENCVVSGSAQRADYGMFRQTLSIKCVAHGQENYFVDRRRVTVSDDTFLVLNEGRVYASSLSSNPTPAYSFSIFFRPGLGEEVAAAMGRSLDATLELDLHSCSAAVEFDESLRHHDSRITPVLRFIQRNMAAGIRDEGWLEEQCQFLLETDDLVAAVIDHRSMRRSSTTRAERNAPSSREDSSGLRITCTQHLARNITLDDIAAAARLSRFHFLRVFTSAHGRTPMTFLRELRMRRALALLGSTSLAVSDIAERVGMSRVTLWRSLRAGSGNGARGIRQGEEPASAAFLPR